MAGIRTIADAIRRQDEITLGANNMPTNKAIEETERRADDASRRYYLLQEIRQLYFKDGGIQSELAALLEIAEYLPDGMRMISADKCILPLQAMVWNTVINTLIRQHNGLAAKMAKLSAVPPLVSSRPVPNAEICALLARPYTTEELPNAVSAYIERMKSAEESLERYAPLATPEKIASAEAFYQGFCKLLDSEICQNLKTFEVLEGETEVDNDGETIVISNTVGAYWNKVKLFAEAVEQFTKCWVEI